MDKTTLVSFQEQYDSAVSTVALADRSAIGRIQVSGKDAIDLLHRLSTNNLLEGKAGQAIGTVFTTDKGRIVDYVHVLLKNNFLLVLTSPTNEEAFVQWIDKYTIIEEIQLTVITSLTSMVGLIGPSARPIAEQLVGCSLKPNQFVEADLSCGNTTVLYRNEFETEIVDFIVDAARLSDLKTLLNQVELDKDVYETFRISRGIPILGHELTNAFNPYEVNLRHAISFNKGCYLGQEVIARLDTYQKVQRQLYGVVFDAADLPSENSIISRNGEDAGILTSISSQLHHDKRIGLGVLKKKLVAADDYISVVSGGNTYQATIQKVPIMQHE